MAKTFDRSAPGDVAPQGTAGTGETICPQCRGTGTIDQRKCENCNGTGKVLQGIGGA
jgi:DnaJ-class molecular chaperone